MKKLITNVLFALSAISAYGQQVIINSTFAEEHKNAIIKKLDSLNVTKEQEAAVINYLIASGALANCYASGGGCGSCPPGQSCTRTIRNNCVCVNQSDNVVTANSTDALIETECVSMKLSAAGKVYLVNKCESCVTAVLLATRYINGQYRDVKYEQKIAAKSQVLVTQPNNQISVALMNEKDCK